MKTIIVRWVKAETFGYDKTMLVVISDHKLFSAGTRFDFGFFNIATDEGYTIVSLPMGKEAVDRLVDCIISVATLEAELVSRQGMQENMENSMKQ